MRRAMIVAIAIVVFLLGVPSAHADSTDARRFGRLGVRARVDMLDPDGDFTFSWFMTAKFRNRSATRGWAGTCRIAWSVDYAFGVYPDASGVKSFTVRLDPDAPTLVRRRFLADVEVSATDTVVDVTIRRCVES